MLINEEENLPTFLSPKELKYIKLYKEFKKNNTLKEPDTEFHKNLELKIKNVTQDEIDDLKKKVLERIENEKNNRNFKQRFIDELTSDLYLRSYLVKSVKNIVDVVLNAIEILSNTSNYMKEDEFPREWYELGINISTGFDNFGNPVLYCFAGKYYPVKKLVESFEPLQAILIFQLVRIALHTNGFFTILIDFSGASVSNVDFHALRSLINIIHYHAPYCLNRIICHNVHWLLKPAFKIGLSILPFDISNILAVVSKKELENFVTNEQLSSLIEEGLNKEIIIGRPQKNGKSFLDISENMKLTKEETEKIIATFKKFFEKKKYEYLSYE